jgi:hypothetical protein
VSSTTTPSQEVTRATGTGSGGAPLRGRTPSPGQCHRGWHPHSTPTPPPVASSSPGDDDELYELWLATDALIDLEISDGGVKSDSTTPQSMVSPLWGEFCLEGRPG